MREVVLGAILLGLPLFPLQANLGASPDEAKAKYGQEQGPVSPVEGADKATQYSNNFQLFNVHFLKEKAVFIQVAGKRTQLTPAQVSQILRRHNNGRAWERNPLYDDRWATKNGRAIAEFNPQQGQLFLIDTAWQAAQTTPPDQAKSSSDQPKNSINSGGQVKGGTVIHRHPGK